MKQFNQKSIAQYCLVSSRVFGIIVGPIAVGYWLGGKLDRYFACGDGAFTLGLILLGILTGFIGLIKMAIDL